MQLSNFLEIDVNDNCKNLNIDNIKLQKKNRTIRLSGTSSFFIDYNDLNSVVKKIENHFNNYYKIIFNLKYTGEEIPVNDFLCNYRENILHFLKGNYSIIERNPDCIDIQIEKDEINIHTTNNLIFNKMNSDKLTSIIESKIKDEYNKIINININYDKPEVIINNKDIIEKELIYLSDNSQSKTNSKNLENKKQNKIGRSKKIDNEKITKISDITDTTENAVICGKVIDIEIKELKSKKLLLIITITDLTDSIIVKYFSSKKDIINEIKINQYIKLKGNAVFDNYIKQLIIMANKIKPFSIEKRIDLAVEKRVELHLHTSMSSMDGINNIKDYTDRAKEWGHKALAVTDHGIVQAFPDAMYQSDDKLKIIYGMEGYLVDDDLKIVNNTNNKDLNDDIVVFDIETTGFNQKTDAIIEIGAVKIRNKEVIDSFNSLIFTEKQIPNHIVKLTGISNEDLKDAPKINEVLLNFLNFIGENSILAAHNASFDIRFIKEKIKTNLNKELKNASIDTLEMSRALVKNIRNYKLNTLAKKFNIDLHNHHRAVDDAEATAKLLLSLINMMENRKITNFVELEEKFKNEIDISKKPLFHIIILAKNNVGLKNLYQLVSESHLEYFHKKPRILKSSLSKFKDGLILGTACEAGELYKAVLNGLDDETIEKIIEFYDYLEIQPIANNLHLIRKGILENEDDLININKQIVSLGEKYNKLVVATGDVHFLDKEDELFRCILMYGQGYNDAEDQAPIYYMTTDEMLNNFSYLGEDKAFEIVVKNTNKIADEVEQILPIPKGTFPPIIEGADEDLKKITYNKAKQIYGENLPDIVKTRLDRELNSIISNGYAVMYIIAQKLVKKSLDDGYIVGSRGSVGSSFAATMSSITEVNPLKPHYICQNCKYSEFITDGSVSSGADLADKNCPKCNKQLSKDGHDIPFEVFLGFEGDKEPDIDLNFAGEEQSEAMRYTEELFGKGKVFRAGTIGTIASKTAYGFVKNYYDDKEVTKRGAEINRVVNGCTGIKRTSGQHPGGVMVVPHNKDIHDFTPVQYPANNKKSGVITTHFDYHSISGRILKLDILGHDTPSIIRMLEDFTSTCNNDIPLVDKKTMQIFNSPDVLGISSEDINCETGTLGIPEFGTNFVRQMLLDTKPTTFSDLVRISGLSHGTDVWLNNAQELVKNNIVTIKDVISTRDDIMTYLIYNGLEKKQAFDIMERVRKGKGLRECDLEAMKNNNIPQWYIDSCNKIKYMFPKAHAAAYVMISVKIAYYKVYYPEAFYASYFTMKAEDFDADIITKGIDSIKDCIIELNKKGNDKTAKEKNLLTVLEVALEMNMRGYRFTKVDLYKSDDRKFLLSKDGIIPPLIGLQGVGQNAAKNIKIEREISPFISVEDITKRAKVTKTVIEVLENHGCLKKLDKTNQISIFNV